MKVLITGMIFYIVSMSCMCRGTIHGGPVAPPDSRSKSTGPENDDEPVERAGVWPPTGQEGKEKPASRKRGLFFRPTFSAKVVALELYDATANVKVVTLTDKLVIATNTTNTPSFSVNAVVEGKGVGSVVLAWTNSEGTTTEQIERTAPYTLCANEKGEYNPCPGLGFGTHTLSVKACSKRKGKGKCSAPYILAFQIERPSTKAPAPVVPTPPLAPVVPSEPRAPAPVAPTPPLAPVAPSAPRAPVAPTLAPSSKPSRVPSSKLSRAPSSAPTAIDCTSNTISAIAFINCNTLTNQTLLMTGTTQEDKAAQWVIKNNTLLLPNSEANRKSLLQRYALASMRKNGVGESARSECSWFGVTCDITTNTAVTSLEWNNRGGALANALSKDLGLLSDLVRVALGGNGIVGSIPSELKAWTNLQAFEVSNNQLSGAIPAELVAWTNIQSFYAFSNKLNGTIPVELGAWTNMRILFVTNNKFSGAIPSQLGAWINIRTFFVDNNQLSGIIPAELGAWTRIQLFFVNNNQLTGPIPPALGTWNMIVNFRLNNNQLTGPIPTELKAWANAQSFIAFNNQLTGPIPPELGAWTTIRNVQLHNNELIGAIPSQLKAWTNIKSFDVFNNRLTGPIPVELEAWTNAEVFNAYNNQFTGVIPASIGKWNISQQVSLHCNNFTKPQNITFVFCRSTSTLSVYVDGGLMCPCCQLKTC